MLKQLLRATAQGDDVAFKTLYDETSARLLAIAQTMMRDASLAEDVLQDAFVQVWHRAGEYHAGRGSVLTWLTTIVRYRAIDLLRKRRRSGIAGKVQMLDVDPADIDYLAECILQLLRATARGDDVAFKTLYDKTSARLLAIAQTMMRDASLAEDVLQDAFVQVWHRFWFQAHNS